MELKSNPLYAVISNPVYATIGSAANAIAALIKSRNLKRDTINLVRPLMSAFCLISSSSFESNRIFNKHRVSSVRVKKDFREMISPVERMMEEKKIIE